MNRSSPLLNEFRWPRLAGSNSIPRWIGRSFMVGNLETEILRFGESESAWSDELTSMHEAEANSSHPIDLASRRLAVESMRELADRADSIVVDIGCSSGFLIEDFKRLLPSLSVFGADFLTGIVLKAAARNPGTPFVQFDLRKCPLEDQCVDGVTALNVLEHIDSDLTALKEIHRILKPGGIAHVEVPAGPACFDLYDEVLLHFRRYRLTDLIAMAKRIGFVVQSATHLGFLIYPAFRFVKSRNRARYSALSLAEKRSMVKQHISRTGSSLMMRIALGAELSLGRVLRFPCGIRAVVKLSKPS
jgi:SAM-dependent methyltransferase